MNFTPGLLAKQIALLAVLLTPVMPHAAMAQDTTRSGKTYLAVGVGGFMPLRESYRINYSTTLGPLPIELLGSIILGVTDRFYPLVNFRYIRREANFVQESGAPGTTRPPGAEISMIQLEPGVRYYLDPGRPDDTYGDLELGLFTGLTGEIARTTVSGVIDETTNGNDLRRREVSKDYYNLGFGFDLGLTYLFSASSAIDGGVHVSVYLNDPVASGGLGNIGGVSFDLSYRLGF